MIYLHVMIYTMRKSMSLEKSDSHSHEQFLTNFDV